MVGGGQWWGGVVTHFPSRLVLKLCMGCDSIISSLPYVSYCDLFHQGFDLATTLAKISPLLEEKQLSIQVLKKSLTY